MSAREIRSDALCAADQLRDEQTHLRYDAQLIVAADQVIEKLHDQLESEFHVHDWRSAGGPHLRTDPDQYAHVLSTFSHSSHKDAPRQCLAAFDELQSLGHAAFIKKHHPYWNIPLNENLPQPVIDLPIPEAAPDATPAKSHRELFDFQKPPPRLLFSRETEILWRFSRRKRKL